MSLNVLYWLHTDPALVTHPTDYIYCVKILLLSPILAYLVNFINYFKSTIDLIMSQHL